MEFTSVHFERLAKTNTGEIYRGLTYNFFNVDEMLFDKEESKFLIVLEKLISRKISFNDLSGFNLPNNFVEDFREKIISVIEINHLLEQIPSRKMFVSILESLIILIAPLKFISNKSFFAEKVLHNSIGLKQLSFFSLENDFEELMINSLDEVFVFHRQFGLCKTNIVLNQKSFDLLLLRIASSVGKEFNANNPLLDARLPDGNRVNATFNTVSPKGNSLTIRKFSEIPFSIIDLINDGVMTFEAAAFLWVMVEGLGNTPKNILIVGGTASGKTTLLSVLSNFIKFSERIVSIEDTLEIMLAHRENWVALEAKKTNFSEITMGDLLKNSLRMRPDRLIVGEVRGEEANILFNAMNNGQNGCLGTLHANTAKDAILKLGEKPFAVPKSLLPLVDLIVVMQKTNSSKGAKREVFQIAEITRMENKVLLSNVFENENGSLFRTDIPSHIIEEFANENNISKNELKNEINTRQMILEWIASKNVKKSNDILEIIQSYYFDSKKLIDMVYASVD